MDKIFKIINCCSREEIHNNSELNVKIDNSQENNQSFINSKLEEKDKSSEIKNEKCKKWKTWPRRKRW